MALQVRRNISAKVRIVSTLIAVFALVMQPTYGLVASQVANALGAAPVATTVTQDNHDSTGWYSYSVGASLDFEAVSGARLGNGALKMSKGNTTGDYTQFYRETMSPMNLSDISLGYSSKRIAGNNDIAPGFGITVDEDGNFATTDDIKYYMYEPTYNSTVTNYDAWNDWSINSSSKVWQLSRPASSPWVLHTIGDLSAANTNAKVKDYWLNLGTGNNNSSVLVDRVVEGDSATYNFEPTTVPDTTPPDFAVVGPTNGQYVSGDITLKAEIKDVSDITKVLMNIGGKSHSWANGSSSTITRTGDIFSVTVDTTTLSEGPVHVTLRGTDGSGNTRYWNNNSALRQHVFYVDNTNPITSITSAAQTNKDTVTLTKGSASDENLSYYYCWLTTNSTVTVDGHTYTPGQEVRLDNDTTSTRDANCETKWANGQTPLSGNLGNFNVKNFPSGDYTVNLIAVDKAGNKSTAATKTVMIDHTNPTGSVETIGGKSYSTSGTTVKLDDGKLVVTGVAEDNNAMNRIGVQLVKPGVSGDIQYVYADDNKLYGKTGQIDWTAEFNSSKLSGLADGQYAINIYYVDKIGNVETQKIFFTLDDTRPIVSVSLSNTDYTIGNVVPKVTINADDNIGVDYVQYKILNTDGTTAAGWFTINNNEETEVTAISGLEAGNYTLRARAFDEAGNKKSGADVIFTVNQIIVTNPTEGGEQESGTNGSAVSGNAARTNLVSPSGVTTLGNGPLALNLANIADTTDTADSTADDEGETLGVSDKKGSGDNKGDVLAATDDKSGCDKFLGLCWYWWIPIAVAVLGAIWFYLASRRESDPDPFSGPARRQ